MKSFFLIFAALLVISSTSFASNADLFTLDENKVESSLEEATNLESMFLENENTADFNENLGAFTNFEMANFAPNLASSPPLNIPSFWWGFCFSATGILVVYLVADDKDETMSALKGCVVGGLAYTGCYIIYIIAVLGSI